MIRFLTYYCFSFLTTILFGFALLMGGSVEGQTQIFVEDFEDATITYSPSVSEFTDGSGDYFIRTNETNIGSAFTVSNIQDSYYFGAQDLDGEGATLPLFLNFDNIGIAGYSSLTFKVYLAEDDDGTNEDWDAADYVHIGYDIDNTGSYSELLWIESSAGTNTEPAIDTDFDGIGDGAKITDVFTQYSVSIPSTGSDLDIQIEFNLDSGDEDIAIDHIEVYGTIASSGPTITNISLTPTSPTSSDAVSLSADITDSDGIAGAEIHWGTTSGSLVNDISMSNSGGDTYTTNLDIPAQSAGTTVYYEVYAEDNNTDETTSAEQSYTVSELSTDCGSETFDNSNATGSYSDGSFVGDNGVTWTYVESRDESSYGINGNGLMLRQASDNSKLTSSTVSGGIGDFTCSLRKAFTGSGNRQVELFVNSVSKGTSIAWDNTDVQTFSVDDINIEGDVIVEIRNITSNQVIIDDIAWSCYVNTDPTITVSSTILTDFSYIFGNGPSDEQSFTISGSNLTDDITITPSSNYEISTGTGGSFVATNPIALTQSGGDVTETTIYVRLKTGLSAGDYNSEDITASSTDATNKTVTCSGMVNPSIISVSETEITDFEYPYENGPSASQTFNVEGSNLTGNLIISSLGNYELSDDDVNFGTSVSLTPVSNQVSSTTIYVRMKAGLAIGAYNDENITVSSTGADDKTLTCSGAVVCPSISAPIATAASAVLGSSFSANWDVVADATGYNLDVYRLGAPASDLIISEYIEGSSNNKYIEIYNGTGAEVNLSDYDLEFYANDATSPTNVENLTGTLSDGATLVFENSSATIYSGTASSSSVCNFNGNDAIVLTKSGTDIDVIGTVGDDSPFAEDVTLIRKASVSSPNSTFDSGEWDSYSIDYEELGTHTYSGGTTYHLQNDDVGNVTTYNVTGLTPGETYYYVVRAYNGCGSESANSNEITVNLTCSDPTTQASSLSFPDTQTDQMDVSWTNGDGDYRLVVASTSAITGTPSANTTYSADANFGDGDVLNAGEFVVYAGSGSSVTMTGLNSDTEYFIKVFEYNCDGGSEQYLTTSPLSGSETTVANIPAVTDFDVTCMTETTATLEWTNPSSGDWAGVAIAVRRGTNLPQVLSSFDLPSDLIVNTTFGNAGSEYGDSPDYSYAIYKGTETSVIVTGLTQGEDYVFKAFSYYNDGYDNSDAVTTTSITGLNISEVSSANVAAGDGEALVSWANPGCYDEILVVGKDGGSVTSSPSGDGSAYSADASFGVGSDIGTSEYVVYKGTGSSINVTSLTNDNTYYFKIFVRIGTEWSNGVEVFVVPADVTVLEGGDIAIISINTQYLSSGGDDEWCFISFKDITEGTSIEFTDNGYERELEGLWGDTEGTIRLTRNSGGTIPAGTPICVQGAGNLGSDFTIIRCGVNDDANWSISSLNGFSDYNLNSEDQIWVFQNGSWDNPSGDQNADYTGNVVWGWTGTGWEENENYASTSGSTVPPGAECFNSDLSGFSSAGKYAYIGDMDAVTQIEWILRINDADNWSEYIDNTDFFTNGPDYANTCQSFSITPGGYTHGTWTGQRNTEWFECANWESLVIPDETTDVLFDNDDCSNDIELLAGETAECNDLTLQGTGAYSLWGEADPTKVIEVFGDLTIKNADLLVFDDFIAGTDDGTIILHGNWNNEAGTDGFWEGNSLLVFDGNQSQTINSTEMETFNKIKINKTINNVNLQQNITTSNLEFVNGLLSTDVYSIFIDNPNESALSGFNLDSYVSGNLRRAITGAGSCDFPVGNMTNYQLATIDITSATSLTYLDAHFTNSDFGDINIGGLGLQVDGTPLVSVLDAGYWQIEPNTGASVNYDIEVNLAGADNAAADAGQHAVIKRDDAASDWELQGNHDNATQSIAGGVVTAKVSGLSAFSQFAIARSNQWVLAVELIDFSVKCETAGLSVNWTTASEDNADYFMIEYSSDTKNWETVQKLPAFGTTHITQEYQVLLEDSPRKGYYRLAEVDMDGTITHYAPDYINCLDADEQAMITVSPNPAIDFARLSALKTTSNLYLVAIYDAAGKLVNMLTWENPAEHALKLDLYGFAPGYYQLKIYNEREFYNKKLLVK